MPKDKTILEKEIIEEISGVNYGGFEGGDAFTSFPTDYYEKKLDASEKKTVEDILMELLKNNKYDPGFRSKVAWICNEMNLPSAKDEIKKLHAELKGNIYSNMTKAIVDDMAVEKQLIDEISKKEPKSDKQIHHDIYSRALALKRKLRGDASKMWATKDKKLIEKKEDELARYVINSLLKKILKGERYDSALKAKIKLMLADLNIDIDNLRI